MAAIQSGTAAVQNQQQYKHNNSSTESMYLHTYKGKENKRL